jgi:DNA-binding winged helix-turn-helix (wHTH) protein/tetratricopeptide (TPR) repeat protein
MSGAGQLTRIYEFGPYRLVAAERLLLRDVNPVPLEPKVFETLLVLVQNSGHLVEKDVLMKEVWPNSFVEESNLSRNISVLRKILNQHPDGHHYIETVQRIGYRFIEPVRELHDSGAELVLRRHTRYRAVIEEKEDNAREDLRPEVTPRDISKREFSNIWFGSRRNRTVLIVSISLVVVAAVVVGWVSSRWHRGATSAMVGARAEAQETYLKGRALWNKRTSEGLFQSISFFEEAIKKDPSFALGYAGLSDAYAFDLELWPKAEELANKALELDHSLAQPHATLGFIRSFWQWNWLDAEVEFRKAIELDPRCAQAHQWYALNLAARSRLAEGLIEMKRAVELEPLSPVMNSDLAQLFYFLHDYDRATIGCKKVLEIDPDFINAHTYLYQAYTQRGMYAEAVAEFLRLKTFGSAIAIVPSEEEMLRSAYASRGINGFWKARIEGLEKAGYSSDPYSVAQYHALLGENDQAAHWLEKALELHAFSAAFAAVDPVFDRLRGEPGFPKLVRRLNPAF